MGRVINVRFVGRGSLPHPLTSISGCRGGEYHPLTRQIRDSFSYTLAHFVPPLVLVNEVGILCHARLYIRVKVNDDIRGLRGIIHI